jgi:hypothetical protein
MPRVATFDDPEFFGEHWADIHDEGRNLDATPAVGRRAEDRCVLGLATGAARVGARSGRRASVYRPSRITHRG